jgi:hypothetical protein
LHAQLASAHQCCCNASLPMRPQHSKRSDVPVRYCCLLLHLRQHVADNLACEQKIDGMLGQRVQNLFRICKLHCQSKRAASNVSILTFVVLCHLQQLRPAQYMVEVVLHLVILRQAPQVSVLHLQDVFHHCWSYTDCHDALSGAENYRQHKMCTVHRPV